MRISDWSSDVCSSDLFVVAPVAHIGDAGLGEQARRREALRAGDREPAARARAGDPFERVERRRDQRAFPLHRQGTGDRDVHVGRMGDRKGVAEGRSVYVRVTLRGRRFYQKTKNNNLSYMTKK